MCGPGATPLQPTKNPYAHPCASPNAIKWQTTKLLHDALLAGLGDGADAEPRPDPLGELGLPVLDEAARSDDEHAPDVGRLYDRRLREERPGERHALQRLAEAHLVGHYAATFQMSGLGQASCEKLNSDE